jgi:hypothetical protein
LFRKVKPNRFVILASIVSPLTLIVFLKTLMWASWSISFTYVGYRSFWYGILLVGSYGYHTATNGYHGGMNILELGVHHSEKTMHGSCGGPPSGFWLGDPWLGKFSCGFPPIYGCKLTFLGYWIETSLPWIGSPLVTCMLIGKVVIVIY